MKGMRWLAGSVGDLATSACFATDFLYLYHSVLCSWVRQSLCGLISALRRWGAACPWLWEELQVHTSGDELHGLCRTRLGCSSSSMCPIHFPMLGLVWTGVNYLVSVFCRVFLSCWVIFFMFTLHNLLILVLHQSLSEGGEYCVSYVGTLLYSC